MNSTFAQLYSDFCRIGGLAAGEISVDEEGTQLVRLGLHGIEVELVNEHGGERRIFSRVSMFDLQSHAHDTTWADLLEANYTLLCAGRPTFSLDPWSGRVVAQQVWSATTTPQALLHAISAQCALAADWQAGRLDLIAPPQVPADDDAANSQGHAALERLYEALRTAPGLEALQLLQIPSGGAFVQFTVQGVEVQVCGISRAGDTLHIFVELEGDGFDASELDLQLAEANAWLLPDRLSPVLCRRALTGEVLLATVFTPAPGSGAREVTRIIEAMTTATLSLRAQFTQRAAAGPTEPNPS